MSKILIISKCPTHPTNAGNRAWILSQMEILKQLGNNIHFLYIQELPLRQNAQSYKEDLNATSVYWGNNFYLYKVSKLQKLFFNIKKIIDQKWHNNFYGVDETYPFGLEKYVNRLDREQHYDICIVNYAYLTKLFTQINIPKKALSTHDCLAYKYLKVGYSCRSMTAHQEAIAMQRSPHIFALQDEEAAYFHLLSPCSEIYKVYSPYQFQQSEAVGNKNILFLSGSNNFNQNGIKWFMLEVFPLIRKRFTDAKLLIGGSICNVLNGTEHLEGIELLGYIDNPKDFYAKGDIAINPVYQGTGLKIKTFEAISYDKVTMVHPHSMAGIFKKEQAPLFASENPQDWVEFLKNVWNNESRIAEIKQQNAVYIKEMNEFIINEYKRFLFAEF